MVVSAFSTKLLIYPKESIIIPERCQNCRARRPKCTVRITYALKRLHFMMQTLLTLQMVLELEESLKIIRQRGIFHFELRKIYPISFFGNDA